MNKKPNQMKTRWLAFGLLIALLALTLVSCGGQAKVTLPEPTDYTLEDPSQHSLSSAELKVVSAMIRSVYDDEKFDVRDMLIAANRGYDMTAEGFDDKNLPEANLEKRAEFARNVLKKANEQAKDADKIEDAIIAKVNEKDLERIIDLYKTEVDVAGGGNFWNTILGWIGTCLNWITRYLGFGSYIVGICVFAVIVEILMLPFAVKQQKNSIKQAKLRPKEMAIRNKYKGRNDQVTQQKVQKEIQDLYQRENYSPYSGCLPLLIQMPILIALYNIVINPLHYVLGQTAGVSSALTSYYTAARAAGGLGLTLQSSGSTIELLSRNIIDNLEGLKSFQYFTNSEAVFNSLDTIEKIPNFNIFGLNFGYTPSFDHPWLLLVPVLTFVVYYFSMKLSRKFTYQPAQEGANDRQVACSNAMMDISMPAMSTVFAFIVPAIIGVYWVFRSLLGTLKQFIMSRVMPLPTFTEADYKAAAKEMAGKAPKVEKSERAGSVRSLHHIDDEDFDDTRERALAQKAAMEEQARREQEEKIKKTPFGAPEMKKDRKSESKEKAASEQAEEISAEDAEEKKDQD